MDNDRPELGSSPAIDVSSHESRQQFLHQLADELRTSFDYLDNNNDGGLSQPELFDASYSSGSLMAKPPIQQFVRDNYSKLMQLDTHDDPSYVRYKPATNLDFVSRSDLRELLFHSEKQQTRLSRRDSADGAALGAVLGFLVAGAITHRAEPILRLGMVAGMATGGGLLGYAISKGNQRQQYLNESVSDFPNRFSYKAFD